MKNIFLVVGLAMLALLSNSASAADERRFSDNYWGAFGFGSDADRADTGLGAGVLGRIGYVENIFFTGRFLAATYDNVDRGQLLLGGEWVDRNGNFYGYVGLQVGAEYLRNDNSNTTDGFARAYYDLGWRYAKGSEMRFGIARDVKNESFQRQWGLRAGWYVAGDDDLGYFINAEAYEKETNVMGGVTWGF